MKPTKPTDWAQACVLHAISAEPMTEHEALRMFADPSNWQRVHTETTYGRWVWIGPAIPPHEWAASALDGGETP